MFGKRFGEYVAFQKLWLILIAIVGIVRLAMSLGGVPDSTARWSSMTVVGLAGFIYYGIAVHTRGFGSYKQLLPLVFIQSVLTNLIVIFGILLAMGGHANIYAAPEYGGSQWTHIFGHIILGMGVGSMVGWGLASLVLLITKKLAARPAAA